MRAWHRTRRITAAVAVGHVQRQVGMHTRGLAQEVQDSGILVEEHTVAKLVTLDRPKVLNALNLDMVRALYPHYSKWVQLHEAKQPCCVVVCGAGGKAFCAGGDVVGLSTDKAGRLRKDFFPEEYRLNYLIKTMTMPHVAILDGITMGGGVGLSVHGSHRIITEKTLFAMPETGIGLFPDVGGSIFLPRLPHSGLGMFLALTGERLKGADCLHAGVGTHFVPSEKVAELKSALLQIRAEKEVDEVLKAFGTTASQLPTFSLSPRLAEIERIFTKPSVDNMLSELSAGGTEWHDSVLKKFDALSPTSVRVTHEQMVRGAQQTPLENLRMEARIGHWMLNHGSDFDEGIRALLIDKDKNPQWKPASLSEVTPEMVAKYFEPLGEFDWDPTDLKLWP